MVDLRVACLALMVAGCSEADAPRAEPPRRSAPSADEAAEIPVPALSTPQTRARAEMVARQLKGRDITDPRLLAAMGTVPRHEFVPESWRRYAYDDRPLPIGYDVTISQPYIVALMIQLAGVEPGDAVLDVGTGSGYQAAVLDEMGANVWGIEIVLPLADRASERLAELGYDHVEVRAGDGYAGWPEHAPFDAIVVAAAAPKIPRPLKEQLKVGGRLVLPVGADRWTQVLTVVTRTADGYTIERVKGVAFVPMVGEVRG